VRARRGVDALVLRRAQQLVTKPAPAPRFEDRPLQDRGILGSIGVPTLVVTQEGDTLHPADLGRSLARDLDATLLELPEGGVFWTAGRQLQDALADHLR